MNLLQRPVLILECDTPKDAKLYSSIIELCHQEGKKDRPSDSFLRSSREVEYRKISNFLNKIFDAIISSGEDFVPLRLSFVVGQGEHAYLLATQYLSCYALYGLVWFSSFYFSFYDLDLEMYQLATKIAFTQSYAVKSPKLASSIFRLWSEVGSDQSMGMLFEFRQHLQDKALIDTIDQYLATYCQKKGMTMVQLGLKAPKIVIEDCETGFAQEVCKLLDLCEAEGAKTKPTQKFLKACDQISKDLDVAKMTTFLQGVFELCLQQRPHHLSFKDIYFLVSFVDKNGKTFTLKSSRISDYSLCGLIWFSYFYDLDLAIYEQVLAKATSKLRYCGLRSPKLASSIFWLWFKIGSDKSIALLLRFRKKFRHKTLTSLIFRYS